ncbi:unnamed protein product [Mytilus edulis]|uniref:Uncharacterized protein n=1 Tax=Mytilus edulis TaxID=6550 RepID=A0A8S3SE25_MYTED|nr:unnamed protein product [Mytilus edulis]
MFYIFAGFGLASAKQCYYYKYLYKLGLKYCSNGCCSIYKSNPCCVYYYTSTTLSNGAYYGMGGGGLVFILVVVGCCWYCCKSKKSYGGQTVATVQQAMPYAPYTITPGAHPFGMTNNCVPGGYNIPISTAPIIKSKKSSSLSSSIGSGISNMLEMAGNANEMGECMNEMGGNFSEIAEDCM